MANMEILEGLRAGLERGQSLKRTMMSFYNAGYSKAEIEEAARALSQQPKEPVFSLSAAAPSAGSPSKIPQKTTPQFQEKKENKPKNIFSGINFQKKPQPVQVQQQPQTQQTVQNVSQYEKPKNNHDKLMIIILISVLVLLVGILAVVFFFREQIISWFSG